MQGPARAAQLTANSQKALLSGGEGLQHKKRQIPVKDLRGIEEDGLALRRSDLHEAFRQKLGIPRGGTL